MRILLQILPQRRAFLLTLLVVAALFFAAAGQRVQSQPAVKQAVLRFPADRSLGKLFRLKIVDPASPQPELVPYADARANVTVPASTRLMLRISYTGATDLAPLANCADQEVIYSIDGRNVDNLSDQSLRDIAKLKSVKELLLKDTDITDKGAQYIASMPQLVHLDLCETMITARGLSSLRSLTALRTLDAAVLSIKGTDLACLVPMVHLEYLDLSRTRLSNEALKNLSKVITLGKLRMTNNSDITDEGVPELANLRNLKELNLIGTGVTKKVLTTLQKMKQLNSVALSLPPEELVQIRLSLRKTNPGCQVLGSVPTKIKAEFFHP